MANHTRKTRLALVAALSDATTGFNANLATIAAEYEIQPFELDFGPQSRNVVFGLLDEDSVDVSTICQYPGAVIYFFESVAENKMKGATFSGFIAGSVALYIRLRALDDENVSSNQPDFSNNFEKWAEACEDAMSSAIKEGRRIMSPIWGVSQTQYRCDRDPIIHTGDGHIQKITFTLGFEVHV